MEEDWDNDVGLPPPASEQQPYVPPQYNDRNYNNNNFKAPQESRFNQDRRGNMRHGGDHRRGGRDSSRSSSASRGEQFTFYVETAMLGKLIGKGGSKIRELQEQSGARININKDCTSGDNTLVVISGPKDAQELAKNLIDSLLSENIPQRRPTHSLERTNQSHNTSMEIDWDQAAKDYENYQKEKWAQYADIKKNFYIEDPVIANLSPEEVEHIRKENNEISVQLTFVSDEANKSAEGKMIPNPIQKFEQAFKNYPDVLTEIRKQGFTKPSPIQCQAWPILLSGKDMIGIAQTGTGKTLAFLLPALIHIDNQITPRNERSGPTVLVMAPTRELALQIEKEVNKYYYHGIKAVCVYGGGSMKEQINTVNKGVEIVIATPGRLNDLVQKGVLDVKCVSYLVLDEADRMLDMGFEPQIRKTLLDVRPDRQTVMTSATWPPGVRRLAQSYMKDPLTVCVGSLDLKAVHSVTQRIYIMDEEEKIDMLQEFFQSMGPEDKAIIFFGKKVKVDEIGSELALKGVKCQSIHGSREQSDREQALEDIKSGDVHILLATDVASRGIDIEDITHVLNFDFPRDIEEYVHRVGRTGRAGRTGESISFMTRKDWSQASHLIKILEEAEQEIPNDLYDMAERYEAMRKKRAEENEFDGRGGGRRYGGGGGGGGRGGGGRGGGGGRRGGSRFGGGDRW